MNRPALGRDRVAKIAERLSAVRVAVVGDLMLDRYFWGGADRISPEAPVPVVKVVKSNERLGGAANVAANLRSLGASVELVGAVGDDRAGQRLLELCSERGIEASAVHRCRDRETTEKVRIIARGQQVVRADFEADGPIAGDDADALVAAVRGAVVNADAVVVSDYGKGLLTESYTRDLISWLKSHGKPVAVDPHVPHFSWYGGATVITPNSREMTAATGIAIDSGNQFVPAVEKVCADMGLGALLVTRGEDGMSLVQPGQPSVHIPTVATQVFDVTGAGDTVIAVLTAALAAGEPIADATVLANAAAGIVVREVGTTTVTTEALIGSFTEH